MGIFNKLQFWKKDDDLDFDTLADKELSQHGIPSNDDFGSDQNYSDEKSFFPETNPNPFPKNSLEHPQFSQPSPPQNPFSSPNSTSTRDLELISSKLDTIRAMLSSLEQRMAQIEKAVGGEQKQRLW